MRKQIQTRELSLLLIVGLLTLQIGCGSSQATRLNHDRQGMSMKPLVVGHRGAPGHTPEHTLHSYEMAVEMGADVFEPDLVSTKDGILIARHENEISGTTNVALLFPERKRSKSIDGQKIEGYFTEDFTLAEIKLLTASERLPFRNQKENGLYPIATFEEILQLREGLSKTYGRPIGLAPELKHSTYFRSIHLPLEEKFMEQVKAHKLDAPGAPIMVQSFEVSNLKWLREKLPNIQLVQLLDEKELAPFDLSENQRTRVTYAQMATSKGLKDIASYANWVSPWKPYIFPNDPITKKLLKPTDFVAQAHHAGLKVMPYTFRNEEQYLSPEDRGNPGQEYQRYFEIGVDAVFSDFADTAVLARDQFLKKRGD